MEIELKFQIPRGQRKVLLAAVMALGAHSTPLRAVYWDTADKRLASAGLALRLRLEGDQWVQTLKGRGDGMLHRQEHEVLLGPSKRRPACKPQRHSDSAVGQLLLRLLADGTALQQVYSTHIQRLHALVRVGQTPGSGPSSSIEIALDRGHLLANGKQRVVHEIEFELKAGSVHALLAIVRPWLRKHHLWWDVRTKSEMGYRLASGLQQVPAVVADTSRQPAKTRAETIRANLQLALPNAAELAAGQGNAKHARQLAGALQRLVALLGPVPEVGNATELWDTGLRSIDGHSAAQVRSIGVQMLFLDALELSV